MSKRGHPSAGGFKPMYPTNGKQALAATGNTPFAAKNTDNWTGSPTFDAAFESAKTNLRAGRDNAIGGATYGEKAAGRDFGFTLKRDPDGNVNGFDQQSVATNPFSKIAMLQRSYDQRNAGESNSYASQGQLYSGALLNARDASTFDQQYDTSTLTNSFADVLRGYADQKTTAVTDYNSGVSTAAALSKLQALLKGGS